LLGVVLCLPAQWDKVENKTTVVAYGVGGIVLIWFSSTLVTALNSIPLVRGGNKVYAAAPAAAALHSKAIVHSTNKSVAV
jgi:hypothetical protein